MVFVKPLPWVHHKYERAEVRAFRADALTAQGGECYYCETRITAKEATADHKHPKVRYGPDTRENIVAACRACNLAKSELSEGQFFKQIKAAPTGDTAFPIMLAWMRRRINKKAKRVCERIAR